MKKLLLSSAIPAKATYQAENADNNPKTPPALAHATGGAWGGSSGVRRCPTPRTKKVRSRKKKRQKKATVDLTVQTVKRVVKMNQAYASIYISTLYLECLTYFHCGEERTSRKKPNEMLKSRVPSSSSIWKPGVRMIPRAIQKPP